MLLEVEASSVLAFNESSSVFVRLITMTPACGLERVERLGMNEEAPDVLLDDTKSAD